MLCIIRGLPVMAEFVYAQKHDILRRLGNEAMKLAIFDIDGTLVRGSSERLFWLYLLNAVGRARVRCFAYLLFSLRYLPVYRKPHDQEEQGVSHGL